LYRAEGLSLRHKRPKRNKSARLRQPKSIVTAINEIWSMDFSIVRPQTASSNWWH
jgi:putative transposase